MLSKTLLKILTLAVIGSSWVAFVSAAQKDLNLTERFPTAEGKKVVVDAADLDLTLRTADVSEIETEIQLHISGTGEEKAQAWIESHTPVFTDSDDLLQITVNPGKSGFLGFGRLSARARLGVCWFPPVWFRISPRPKAVSRRVGIFPTPARCGFDR